MKSPMPFLDDRNPHALPHGDDRLERTVSIQGDQVRVTSPSKDELQGAMQQLRAHDFGVSLSFGNYR